MARKNLKIDWSTVDTMLRCMADGVEIAARLGVHPDTLYRACQREKKMAFQDYAATRHANTKTLLRERQIQVALGYSRMEQRIIKADKGKSQTMDLAVYYPPDPSMLKWLGTQYLDQSSKKEHTLEIPGWDIIGDDEDSE